LVGAAAVAGVLAVVFALVAVHVLLAQNQFQLDRLNARSAVEGAQYDRLRLQVAQLESPERVVAAAEGRLGLVSPPKVTYLTPDAPTGTPAGNAPAAPVRSATSPAGASAASPSASADWARVKAQLGARP
jgi:cell division protein FtsL